MIDRFLRNGQKFKYPGELNKPHLTTADLCRCLWENNKNIWKEKTELSLCMSKRELKRKSKNTKDFFKK